MCSKRNRVNDIVSYNANAALLLVSDAIISIIVHRLVPENLSVPLHMTYEGNTVLSTLDRAGKLHQLNDMMRCTICSQMTF